MLEIFKKNKPPEHATPKTEAEIRLEFLYTSFSKTLKKAKEELALYPANQDMVKEGMGARIKERAERITEFVLEKAYYKDNQDRDFIEIGDDFWFVFKSNDLVHKNIKKNIFGREVSNFQSAKEASTIEWFDVGEEVVDVVIKRYAKQARFPENILDFLKRS